MFELSPVPVLAVVLGTFNTGLYLLIRGRISLSLPAAWLAAVLGALAGQALAARLGDPLSIGDFGLLWSSALSWLGIVVIAAISQLSAASDRR